MMKNEELLLTQAEQYFRSNSYESAQSILERILASNPAHARANELMAYISGNTGNAERAVRLLELACQQADCSPEALYYFGSFCLKQRKYQEAIDCFQSSLRKAGDFFEALHDLGAAQSQVGDRESALISYSRAAQLVPDSPELFYNLARLHDDLKEPLKALGFYDKAIQFRAGYLEAWSNKGIVLCELQRYDEALKCFDRAIQLRSDFAEAWSNKGNALVFLKRYEEALNHFERAVRLKPDYSEALLNMGNAQVNLQRHVDALASFKRAFELDPEVDFLMGDLVASMLRLCEWNGLSRLADGLAAGLKAEKKAVSPFISLSVIDAPDLHLKAAQMWVAHNFSKKISLPQIERKSHSKIRVGYYSPDFNNHAVSFLIAKLFEIHDRTRFEIIGYSLHKKPGNDEMRTRLIKAFDQFFDVESLTDADVANLSRDHEIDIAVDLGGFTQNARPGIFSCRAAAIQVNYLGYPGTMGAGYMDYIVADKVLIPEENQKYYAEKIVYLPGSYQANDNQRKIADREFSRLELGLPELGFVFCCFNNNYKIYPNVFEIWTRILRQVEGSVLWLLEDNSSVSENLRREIVKQGVAAERLIFAPRMGLAEHLARHRQADLFLDTLPYNAHTTASDALWAGLPVLTRMGQSFASRVAGSLLSALDLPELITYTAEEYESMAVELATSPDKLSCVKQKLAENRLTKPLFDTALFAQGIESAYAQMYQKYLDGQSPDHISVEN